MTISISQNVRLTFNLVALRKESADLLTGRQWENRNRYVDRCENARQAERELFNERYDVRIANEVRRLTDEAGSKVKEYKPKWAQDDLFDKSARLSQADTNVKTTHENRIIGIDQIEQRALEKMTYSARAENQIHGNSERAFNKAADRRIADRRVEKTPSQQR